MKLSTAIGIGGIIFTSKLLIMLTMEVVELHNISIWIQAAINALLLIFLAAPLILVYLNYFVLENQTVGFLAVIEKLSVVVFLPQFLTVLTLGYLNAFLSPLVGAIIDAVVIALVSTGILGFWLKTSNSWLWEFPEKTRKSYFYYKLRHFFWMFLVSFFPVIFILGLFDYYQSRDLQEKLFFREVSELSLGSGLLVQDLDSVAALVLALAEQEKIRQFVTDNKLGYKHIDDDIHAYMEHLQLFDQFRLLDGRGREIFRMNYRAGRPERVAESHLQDKSNRYYFTRAWPLEASQIFVSPLDLNVEHGEIETPYKPTLRFATPVMDFDGNKKALLVVNYLADRFLSRLTHRSGYFFGDLMLLNGSGYWLFGPEPADLWGFMFPERRRTVHFGHRYPEIWNGLQRRPRGQLKNRNGVFFFTDILPPSYNVPINHSIVTNNGPGWQPWRLVSFVPADRLTAEISQWFFLIVIFVLTPLILLGVWLLSGSLMRHQIAEQELRRSEHSLVQAQAIARMGNWELDLVSGALTFSRGVYPILGTTVAEFQPTLDGFLDRVHPEDRDRVRHAMKTAATDPKGHYQIQHRLRLPDGEERHVEKKGQVLRDGKERSGRLIGTLQDITENKRIEIERSRSLQSQLVINRLIELSIGPGSLEQSLDRALDHILALSWLSLEQMGGIFLLSPDGSHLQRVVQRNIEPTILEKCRQVEMGHCLCGLAAQSRCLVFADHVDERHSVRFDGMVDHGHYCLPIESGERLLGVLVLYLHPGHQQCPEEHAFLSIVSHSLAGLIDHKRLDADLAVSLASAQAAQRESEASLLALKQTQKSLIEAEKMASLGGLVAGVAHEINTPVGILLSAATFLEDEAGKASALYGEEELTGDDLEDFFQTTREATQQMVLNSQRAADLIQSFKQVAVDQTGAERRIFGLRRYIDEILLSLNAQLKKRPVRISVSCPDELELDSLPGALSQCLTNLVTNTLIHAFGPDEDGEIHIEAWTDGPKAVVLRFADNGRGIPADIQDRVFEPFFTTRRNSGGSGLGLHILYNVVHHSLQGSLTLDSDIGKGCVFTLRFPRILPPKPSSPTDLPL